MHRACRTYGWEQKCIEGLDGEREQIHYSEHLEVDGMVPKRIKWEEVGQIHLARDTANTWIVRKR